MDESERERLGLLLEQALARPVGERGRFLETACGAETELLDELTTLLAAAECCGDSLERINDRVIVPALVAAVTDPGDIFGPGDVVSHYEIVERIGGGMGVVYRARDLTLERAVALKFLPPALAADPHARERLHAEAKTASALDHPNIGTVYEIGEAQPGGLYIALAWYDGETLKQRLSRGPLPIGDAVVFTRQIAAALAAAHAAGIVHRDVKPSNIILTRQQTVRLVDFGIATTADAELAHERSTPGTVAYMSPEQTRGDTVDARTDLWSLGVVLYEMLAGQRPFRNEGEDALIRAIRNEAPEPLETLRPDTPPPLARIAGRCLAKDVTHRYAHAEEVLAELAETDRSAVAVQPAGAGHGNRWPGTLRSRRVVSVILAAAVLLGFLGYVARPAGGPPDRTRSALAVLPFDNRSGRPDDQIFVDGLHIEIRSRLARLATLRISSPTAVAAYRASAGTSREIAAELGVDAILEGAVERNDDEISVRVRLVDARTDTQLWSANYDAALDATGLFSIQREIAERVAVALRAGLTDADRARVARPPTHDLQAYRHYLLGRYYWNRRDPPGMDSAAAHFQEALRRDPGFARAHAGLADVHVLGYGPAGGAGIALAIAAARAALRADPELAAAHASLGYALMLHEQHWTAAEGAFQRAIDLDPAYATAHQWYAELLSALGRMDEAVAHVRVAESLDPASVIIGWNVARVLGFARRYQEAVEQLEPLARLYPRNGQIGTTLAGYLVALGRNDEAADVMERLLTPLLEPSQLRPYVDGVRAGRMESLIDFFRDHPPGAAAGGAHQRIFVALGLAQAGALDAAVDVVEQAERDRAFGIILPDLAVNGFFDPLRDDERFQGVLRRMGIDPGIGLRLRERDPYWLAQR